MRDGQDVRAGGGRNANDDRGGHGQHGGSNRSE